MPINGWEVFVVALPLGMLLATLWVLLTRGHRQNDSAFGEAGRGWLQATSMQKGIWRAEAVQLLEDLDRILVPEPTANVSVATIPERNRRLSDASSAVEQWLARNQKFMKPEDCEEVRQSVLAVRDIDAALALDIEEASGSKLPDIDRHNELAVDLLIASKGQKLERIRQLFRNRLAPRT
jgi:hypothetical protein